MIAALESAAVVRTLNQDGLRDESCLALQTEQPWRCDLASYVLANHLTESPAFVRMDLGDATIGRPYLNTRYSAGEFAEGVRQGLLAASEGNGVEQPLVAPSVFGPACGNHVALFSTSIYFDTTIVGGGAPASLNEAIGLALAGAKVVLVDTVPPSLSVCDG